MKFVIFLWLLIMLTSGSNLTHSHVASTDGTQKGLLQTHMHFLVNVILFDSQIFLMFCSILGNGSYTLAHRMLIREQEAIWDL